MRFQTVVCLAAALIASLGLAQEKTEFKTAKEKVSYGFGLNVGRSMLRDGLLKDDLNFALLVEGLKDALNDSPLKLSEAEFTEAFEAVIAPKLQERAREAAAKWEKENQAFLTTNKAKKGVKATASGLQYRVLKSGSGKTPKATDVVRTQYKGSLINGVVFDQSRQPIEFPVNKVIKGWSEALQMMKEGDQWELVIPTELAYGEKGMPPDAEEKVIAPNTTLVFEVELIEVVPAGSPKKPADTGSGTTKPKTNSKN